MDNRRNSTYTPYRQPDDQRRQYATSYSNYDDTEPYKSTVGHSQHDHGKQYAGQGSGGQASCIASEPTYNSAGTEQRGRGFSRGRSSTTQNIHTRSAEMPNAAHFNSRLNSQSGSQFSDQHQYTPQGGAFNHPNNPQDETLEITSPYSIGLRSHSSDANTQLGSRSQNVNPLPSSPPHHDQYGSTFASPLDAMNFAKSEPWAPVQQNPFLSPFSHQETAAISTTAQPNSNHMESFNQPYNSSSTSQYLEQHNSPLPEAHANNSGGRLANALEALHNNLSGGHDAKFSLSHRPSTSATIPVHYGQGRRQTLESPIEFPNGYPLPIGTRNPLQQNISPTTRSTSDISNRQTDPAASFNRRPSTKTSTTTTSFATQGSRPSKSGPRFHDVPDPLPCPKCPGKAYNGPDRITNLRRHCRETHEGFRARCPSCDKEFTRTSAVKRHREERKKKRER